MNTPEIPFSNGTEERAWMGVWCEHCAHDHGMHRGELGEPSCEVVQFFAMPRDLPWPECLIPEPPGSFALPSRMLCTAFVPCGPCGGDPHAERRADITAAVLAEHKAARA